MATRSNIHRLVIGGSSLVTAVVIGSLIGSAQAGPQTLTASSKPPDNTSCSQMMEGSVWQEPTAAPGVDARICPDHRKPRAQITSGGDYLRTTDGRIRMFLAGMPPPPGSPEDARTLPARLAAAKVLETLPVVNDRTMAIAEAALSPEVKAFLPTAYPVESLNRALRSGALVEVEALAKGAVPT